MRPTDSFLENPTYSSVLLLGLTIATMFQIVEIVTAKELDNEGNLTVLFG